MITDKNFVDGVLNNTIQVYEEFETLYYYLKSRMPVNILEIGFGYGGTFQLLSNISTGVKVSVDCNRIDNDIVKNLSTVDNVFFVDGFSQDIDVFEKVKSISNEYDLIFIDGDHLYESVKRDFELYKSLRSKNGIIIFHDIDPNHVHKNTHAGEVYKFWHDLSYGVKVEILCKLGSGKIKSGEYTHGFGGIGIWSE